MPLTIIQQIILGAVQGITEWLPISSSAMLVLIMSNFFNETNISILLKNALFLHLGTFLAALIYFRKDVKNLFRTLFNYNRSMDDDKKIFNFILIATIISGIIGIIILFALDNFQSSLEITGKTIALVVGILLLITGTIQIKIKNRGLRAPISLKNSDSVVLGFAQGLASLPGLSRSGITVSTLLLRKFDDTTALKLSFLLSLPIVLGANIILNLNTSTFSSTAIFGLLTSFVFGLLTIHTLMKLSKKINFGWFVLIFAVLMIVSVLI